ncbi:MAG: hypothetical protein QXZ35_01920, partial [Candidatus Micrarchaeaceae archaeon]
LEKKLDSFSIIFNALDVLAQHIVGMSLTKKWNVDEAFEVVRRAYPYHDLQKRDFIALLNYLAGNYVGLESRSVYGKIWYDEKENMFGRRGRYAKVIYMLNLGTIPDEVSASVIIASTKKWVGNIEEEFLARLKPGDIFTLGGRLYKFEYAKGMKCFVSEAESSAPTIPPWFSEQLPLSFELAMRIGDFRLEMLNIVANYLKKASFRKARHSALPEEADALLSKLPINANAKTALFNYFVEQFLFAGYIPNRNLLLIEATYDGKSGKHYLVFHALFGRRINDALSRLFAMLLGDALDQDIGVMVHDNGFVLMPEDAKVTKVMIDDAFAELLNSDIEAMLRSNLRNTELLKRHFRHVAARSFMILKNYKGWKIAIGKQQFNSQLLFKAIESEYPDFPIINEAYREVLNDVMDLVTLKEILKSIANGPLKYKFIETPTPSPFAHTLITFGSADVVQMKGRVKYLQYLHRQVMKRIKPMQGWLARQ